MKNVLIVTLSSAFCLTACSETSFSQEAPMQVTRSPEYQSDLQNCQQLAAEAPAQSLGKRVLKGAALGAGVGGITARGGTSEAGGAAAGAVLIGAVAALRHKSELAKQRQEVVMHCLIARGHSPAA